jgi:hypothetical protein
MTKREQDIIRLCFIFKLFWTLYAYGGRPTKNKNKMSESKSLTYRVKLDVDVIS